MMKLWLYTDAEDRLHGLNHNNMAGNTGWTEAQDASVLGEDPFCAALTDARNIARYKVIDGVVVTRTLEEMDTDYVPPMEDVTLEKRVVAVEESTADLSEQIDILISGAVADE